MNSPVAAKIHLPKRSPRPGSTARTRAAFVRQLMSIGPGILPFFVTGALTASGGAWNASVVSEIVPWQGHTLKAAGLGAYIQEATTAGDFPRVALGVTVMSVFVVALNRSVWRPLYRLAERRFRFD